jgi:hypothetical protein
MWQVHMIISMLLSLLLHPLYVLHLFEDIRHELLELSKAGDPVLVLRVDFAHEVVEHQHDEVIVIAALSVLEDYSGMGKVIVLKGLTVIHLANGRL